MRLTQWIRDRSDVELERLAREGTRWDRGEGLRLSDYTYEEAPGCLLCNTFDCRSWEDYCLASEEHLEVEEFYIDLARRNGDQETGQMIARLARRELGRRAMEAIGELELEPERVAAP